MFQILPLDEKPTPGWYHPSTGGKLPVFQTQQTPHPFTNRAVIHPQSGTLQVVLQTPDSASNWMRNLPNPGLDKCLV